MTEFRHFDDRFLPDLLPQFLFELPDRWKSKHVLGILAALCTLGLQPHVGQAGIGAVDQVQVSN